MDFIVGAGISIILCTELGRSIFIKKGQNPIVGAVLGGLVGLVGSVGGIGAIILFIINNGIPSSKKFALYRGGPKQLEITWAYGFKNVSVKFDNAEIGTIASRQDAKQGRVFKLPDGSNLQVKLGINPTTLNPLPAMNINDKLVPESATDPVVKLNAASNAFILGGVFYIAGGIFSSENPVWFTVLFFMLGSFALMSGFFIRGKSRVSLNIGVAIAVMSGFTFVLPLIASNNVNMDFYGNAVNLVITIIFVYGLSKGFSAIGTLEKEKVQIQ